MAYKTIVCNCHDINHVMVYETDIINGEKFVYLSIHLNKIPFYKRIIYAIKYIFGHQSSLGAFDEIIISKDNIQGFDDIVKFINDNTNNSNK